MAEPENPVQHVKLAPTELKLINSFHLGCIAAYSPEEVRAFVQRLQDNYDLIGLAAKMAHVASTYTESNPSQAKKILQELVTVISGYLQDTSFLENVSKQMITAAKESKEEKPAALKPLEVAGVPLELPTDNVVTVDFTARKRVVDTPATAS